MARSRNTADTQTASGGPVSPNIAGKNAIINGAFNVWQRGTTSTFATTGWFNGVADRWMGYSNSNNTATLSQQAFTAGAAPVAGYESQYFLRSASTSTATYLAQRIEDVRTFAGQTVTVSFYAKTNTNQTLSYFNLEQNFGSGGSTTVGNSITPLPALTTSWTRFTATLTLASISGKTIGTNSYLALVLQGDVNKNIDIWGVQVEAGSVATPFQTATGSIQGELAACQRYYFRTQTGTNGPYLGVTAAGSATTTYANVIMKQTMRTSPTSVDFSGLRWSSINNAGNITAASISDATPENVLLVCTTTGATTGAMNYLSGTSNATYVGFSAEL
jgi:hypothetical protein